MKKNILIILSILLGLIIILTTFFTIPSNDINFKYDKLNYNCNLTTDDINKLKQVGYQEEEIGLLNEIEIKTILDKKIIETKVETNNTTTLYVSNLKNEGGYTDFFFIKLIVDIKNTNNFNHVLVLNLPEHLNYTGYSSNNRTFYNIGASLIYQIDDNLFGKKLTGNDESEFILKGNNLGIVFNSPQDCDNFTISINAFLTELCPSANFDFTSCYSRQTKNGKFKKNKLILWDTYPYFAYDNKWYINDPNFSDTFYNYIHY